MDKPSEYASRTLLKTLLNETVYLIDDWAKQNPVHNLPANKSFEYTGQNQQGILILTGNQLSEEEQAFLAKILEAIQLSIEDAATVDYQKHQNTDLEEFTNLFKCNTIISIDIPADAPLLNKIAVKDYEVTNYKEAAILYVPNKLVEIDANKDLKRKLWQALKLLFHVK